MITTAFFAQHQQSR